MTTQAIKMTTYPTAPPATSSMDDYSSTTSVRNNCCQRTTTKLRGRPWFIWFISVVEIIVFIAELGVNWSLTGSPIQIKPSFNPVIGPSLYVLIHIGARSAPCMYATKEIENINLLRFPCPNYTGSIDQESCTLSELCGFGGVSTPPNQWFRFILPIFLHGGLLHIAANVFTQLIIGIPTEKKIGSFRFAVIYFISGIFGNIFSANFAPIWSGSVGSSGSIFGIVALYLLNLIFDWQNSSCGQVIGFIVAIIINLGLGLLPMIDNFGHIGGFIMGLLLGLVLLQSPTKFRRQNDSNQAHSTTSDGRLKRYWHTRSEKWWFWLLFRFVILVMTVVFFVLALLNIYLWNLKCTWCKYLNCLPIKDWCDADFQGIADVMNSTLVTSTDTTGLFTSS